MKSYIALLAAGASLYSVQLAAQEQRSSRLLEEVVVTAQKREENAQDVPISLSAFSGEKLEALGVESAQDLQRITPGLVYSTGPIQYSLIYIRGIGTDVFIPSADSSVATYVDGVYFPYAHGIAGSFTEVERVEVLKGPQGTLFGRNTTGGAINIVTKTPGDEFEAKVKLATGNFADRSARIYGAGPVTDFLSVSLAAFKKEGESYYSPAASSPVQTVPEHDEKGAHLKLRFDITETLTLDLAALKTESRGPLLNSIENTKLAGAAFRPNDTADYEYNSNVDGFFASEDTLFYGTLAWAGDALQAKLFGSNQEVEGATLYDFDGGPGNGVYFEVPDEFVEAKSIEFQLQSVPDGILTFDNTVEWTLGHYYFDSIGGYRNVYFGLVSAAQPGDLPLLGLESLLGILDALGLPSNPEILEKGVVDTESHATYGQLTWEPVDWFGLTVGGRYQEETRSTVVSSASLSLRPLDGEVPLFNFDPQSTSTTNFSPKVAIQLRPFGEDTMLYGSWQQGFKSGTYNVVALNLPPSYVEPEEVTAFEIGMKGSLAGGSFSYNIAAFRNELENLQTLNISLTSGGTSQLSNAAEATIDGVDFDITWEVSPQSLPGLVLTASGAYLDGQYDSFPNGAGFDETTGLYFGPGQLIPAPNRDFSGNVTVRTPEYSGTLGVNYLYLIGNNSELEAGVHASYNSGFFYDTQNTEEQESNTLIGARLSYYYVPMGLRLSAYGANLTDEVVYSDKLINDFGTNSFLAPPRTYGLSLAWEFQGQ